MGKAVPQTITEGVTVLDLPTATVGVLVYMIEGFAQRQSSVPSTLHRTLRNRWKEIDREREINNDVGGSNQTGTFARCYMAVPGSMLLPEKIACIAIRVLALATWRTTHSTYLSELTPTMARTALITATSRAMQVRASWHYF